MRTYLYLLSLISGMLMLNSCTKLGMCHCESGPQTFVINLLNQNDESIFNHPDFDTSIVKKHERNIGSSANWTLIDSSLYLIYYHWPNNKNTGRDTQYYSFYPNDVDTFISYIENRKKHIQFNNEVFIANEEGIISIYK